jgi:hypothetical protein
MPFKIVDGNATRNSIALFFSDAVDPTAAQTPENYSILLAGVNPQHPTVAPYYDQVHRAVIITPPTPLNVGDWALVTATLPPGSTTIPLQVNGESPALKKEAKEATSAVEDAVAYPLLTEQVSFPIPSGGMPAGGAYGPAPSSGSVTAMVSKAVSDVLGWKANPADPKGFVGALSQSFDLANVEGHVEATWVPRGYAVQTDIGGGITGAQASLYTRAKAALDSAMPLLNGLYPLDPDADPEYVKALREMARSQMTEIVKELGTVGGPSVLRVNTYFQILLGPQNINFTNPSPINFDPDKVQGTLGTLRDTYGIYFQGNPFSNSIEDEQDITNFRIISDHLTSLLQSWISNGQFFILGLRNQPAFFGTQLVLLSRQFSVIGETVNEVRFALDSVFIGPSERQTLLLQFSDPTLTPAIFLEDLLREIEDFASDEGPRLLQDGGRISVANNILPVIKTYRHMVREAHKPTNARSLPDGYRTVRVQRTLDDLHDQLHELSRLAEAVTQQVPAPIEEPEFAVKSVYPPVVDASTLSSGQQNVPVVVTGVGFQHGAKINFGDPKSPAIVDPTSTSATVLIANLANALAKATAGAAYPVTVTNPDGETTPPLDPGIVVVSSSS